MDGLAETKLALVIHTLIRRDAKFANKVRDSEAYIDGFEREINERILRMVALRQLMASGLCVAFAVLKISNNLERIGDYAKNVTKRFHILVRSPAMSSTSTISWIGT